MSSAVKSRSSAVPLNCSTAVTVLVASSVVALTLTSCSSSVLLYMSIGVSPATIPLSAASVAVLRSELISEMV